MSIVVSGIQLFDCCSFAHSSSMVYRELTKYLLALFAGLDATQFMFTLTSLSAAASSLMLEFALVSA
eukprot:4647656-Lingulodinium_polyedra.AAC.1